MRHFLRQIILTLMKWLGFARLFRFIHRKQIVILAIHGVMDDSEHSLWKPLRPQLAPAKLEEYVKLLSKYYRFISLTDAVDMLEGRRPLQHYSVVLTFDDGYRNNFTHALPILRRYGVPATFFVATGFVTNPRPFWFDRLDYALQRTPVDGRKVKVGSFQMRLKANDRRILSESYKQLRRTAKELKMTDEDFLRDMDRLAEELEKESGQALSDIQQDDGWSAAATWEDIRRLTDDSVSIGSHTVDHIRLGLVTNDVAKDQLTRSKRDIELHTGRPSRCICYPNGSYTEATLRLARECGYTCGVTSNKGGNSIGAEIMAMNRISMPVDASFTEFMAGLCGLTEKLANLRRRLGGSKVSHQSKRAT